ncbi:N-acetylmuramoyl-L-alanine amidase [Eggerthella lenta]|uniref:N-acetylmuramoyl-L-alanine amidase n=1 Tax=Eggerthella lenta TaxID=84112 RepID=UPI00232F2169|nr:N-acetylmuramoyl-L-alanine amidase [Eggerthella lenta]MDB1767136.1 N-acetylmuramoyl-L-alanine amidase [Eggerthella lenta]
MHQVSSRLSKLALSVMLAFALVPTASVAAMADPQISDPASDPVIQSPSIDQGVSEEAPASTESWQGEGSEPAEADETAQPDSEAEASAAALGPDRQPVGFVYFDESSPSAGGSQLVVVALDDESIELTSAELTLTAPSGASVKATASEYAGNAALFSVDVPEAGEYRLERMEGASAADSRTLLVDLSSCEGEPYAFMVAEPQAEAFSLSDESTGGVSVYALTDDGQLEEASSFEEAAQLSAEAASAVAGRSAASGARSPSGKLVVALDPGHGGSEPGASANGLVERELTWKIALYCKEALESYANVEVVLTRGSDEKVSLVERVNRAVDAGANVFVSLHLNSGPASGNGAEVWYPNDSSYRHELHEEGAQLSSKILEKLTALGLTDRGIKVRDSERVDGEGPFYYPDGSIQDYYTVIEASREAGIVGIIVEHAFLSNKSDSDKLKSEAFLKELGYADAEGIAETYKLSSGWEIDNGRWKLKLADGTYATSSWQQVKGKKYWFGADSYAVTGWQTIDEKRYYFDSSCALRTDGWLKDDGSWYWLSSSGVMQTGWLKLGGTWYWLDPQTGKMATGWTTASDGHRYYFDGSGAMQTGWAKVGGTWYYLSGSGAMQTGWLSKGGSWYWLDPESGAMATGWEKASDGKWYYFEGSGAMRSGGWMKQGSSWYYLSGSGAMQTGWLSKGGSWYWLDPESGRMATGWAKAADGKWYYFEGSGAMRSGGWMKQGGTWYYLNGSGAMHTGWLDLDGKRYYLGESGAMVTGKATIEGETYRFDSSGALLPSDSIMGPSLATVEQMVTLFNAQGVPYPVDKYASRGAATIKDFCQVLLDQARSEDVRAEVLFAQAMVETGWLQFGGDVDRNGKVQCNFGGLGATGNGVAGEEFPDVKTGLLAQAQHLKGYASTAPLNQSCVDTRFGLLAGKRGSAPTVDKLSGTWAADKTYGTKVMNVVDKLLGY